MVTIRRARPSDADAMARVHLATWRSTYAGVLPEAYLTSLSAHQESLGYERGILERRGGHAGFVAIADGQEMPGGGIIGFITGGMSRRQAIAEGEVETLYLLDDFRDRGIGRRLMRAMASHLASLGAESAFAWVLQDNPARWFYERLGAKLAAREDMVFAGQKTTQLAYAWEPIHTLLTATATTKLPR
ncbi:GNAT family N-acetyltransferase [Sediminicoccus sp. KRV36]|uniref:GNAT family N-acetyltransferase n=1 Tax=Sediminicoccus sp. KRV36 TaxID=3133721 RepID=UPI00200DCF64|nr:GNAT family N-acetyltransferase [Sediminicoccus rosea]UPY35779.1 GNAT family N-acetyltransferase [Sediminicoccus rosea]